MAFSRVSKEDSHLPISCEIKEEPSFKSLQGNPAFFRVRGSRCPFHLRQRTQGATHIPIAERNLLLGCMWKVGIPLVSKPDNQLSFREVLGYTEFPRVSVLNLMFLQTWDGVLGGFLELPNGCQTTCHV